MSFGTAKEFQDYTQDCVKLANGDNVPPELRHQLLEMAREWMRALIDEQNSTDTPRPTRNERSETLEPMCSILTRLTPE